MKPATQFDNQYAEALNLVVHSPKANINTLFQSDETGEYVHLGERASFNFTGIPFLTLRDIDIKYSIAQILCRMGGAVEPGYPMQHRHWKDGPKEVAVIFKTLKAGENVDMLRLHGNSSAQFDMIDDKLAMTVIQDNVDIHRCLPHDIAGLSILWHLLAKALEISTFICVWTIERPYIHVKHHDICGAVLTEWTKRVGECPNFSLTNIDTHFLEAALRGEGWLIHELYQNLSPAYNRLRSV